ncbi:N-formylglutamate amidohydrolase [Sphingomonas sp. JC676]|uniref:N-formylglutamate amidohydrolase n=1 Tax=Sphingomonas sp. JC676 TaxID=2768065 RepID=UPI001657E319|nr:N-formylglutamate amidohydrolase [Sphingomonas sp. JC676]MBC9035207.1 N-formylglutamate amidohydrolase [Sphingomonas sp. JC676]
MNSQPRRSLFAPQDPPPVSVFNPGGGASFLLLGDHAGNAIPRALGTLGLDETERTRHIAWDIGIGALGIALAETLDAAFICQAYSRLVVDCNRDPAAPDAIAEISDGTVIPGNQRLTAQDRAARIAAIHAPYQAAITAELARRDAEGGVTVLVALHSFTPSMGGVDRPWQIGVLHDGGDVSFAAALLRALRARGDLEVGDNQPYAMDATDHTIPRHAYARRRPYVELEIRQDLLDSPIAVGAWSHLLSGIFSKALAAGGR